MKRKVTVILFFVILFANFHVSANDRLKSSAIFSENLNTAANVNYLSSIEKELIYEINLFRSNPAKYASSFIEPLAKQYKNKMLYYPGDNPLRTSEGVQALYECVNVLKKAKPLPLLYPSYGLSKAASDHVKDQSRTGRTGHIGSDRSNVRKRIERHGKWQVRIGENIAYGGFSARQVVIYLLIDDGIKNRGHRLTFLQADYKNIGVAAGKHPGYINMYVMDFAGSFFEK